MAIFFRRAVVIGGGLTIRLDYAFSIGFDDCLPEELLKSLIRPYVLRSEQCTSPVVIKAPTVACLNDLRRRCGNSYTNVARTGVCESREGW